jgi:hypothetical protein
MNTKNTIAYALIVAALSAPLSYAQDTAQSLQQGKQPIAEATMKEEGSWTERDSLFLSSTIEKCAPDSGFEPSLVWTGEAWADVSRGNDIHSLFDSLFTLGFEQDLSVPTKISKAGRIGVSAFYYTQSGDGSLGNLSSSQGDFSNILSGEMARVFEIYYANDFETKIGNIGFRVGQLAADEDFMGMDYSDIFLNSSFGALPNVSPAQLFSQYNVATLGLVAYYSYENFDATFGLYNGNLGEDVSSNNGFDYSNTFDTVALWYQFGYNYEIGGLAGRVMFGGNYHSDASKANYDAIETKGFYSFYFGVQQALINNDNGNAMIGAYARVGIVPESEASDQNFYIDFGLNWFAPIPGRDDDVLAIGVSIVENERGSRVDYDHYESAIEVTYKCQLTPAISIQPDLQIFLNPAENSQTGAVYVIGARAEINF